MQRLPAPPAPHMLDIRTKFARLKARLGEALTLREAERRAKGYTPEQSAALARLYDAAIERLRSARDLRDATRIGAASAVYRETLLLVPRTVLLAWDPARAVDGVDAPSAWRELEARLIASGPDARFADRKGRRVQAFRDAQALAEQPDPLFLDKLRPVEALQKLDAAHVTLTRLLSTVEARSARALRRSRLLRLTSLGLLFLAGLVGLVLLAVRPKNVALDKPAQASSYWPGSPPAGALFNGKLDSPWGSATQRGAEAWFAVDLLEEHRISRVVVYNRSDPTGRETLPFAVELSADGKSYREVGRLLGRATPAERWQLDLEGKQGRFVRVKKLDARGLALAEIEVHGKRL
jgi:hypothetical protein